MPWLTEQSSGSSRLTSEALHSLFLTDVLSAIQIQKLSFYTWITGKTSLSKQRFPADTGYTFRCRSIFIGSFPWTFFKGSGSHLLSHAVSSIVSSAASVLTIVFGMGTGVSPKRIATGNFRVTDSKCRKYFIKLWKACFPKVLWNIFYKRRSRDRGTLFRGALTLDNSTVKHNSLLLLP